MCISCWSLQVVLCVARVSIRRSHETFSHWKYHYSIILSIIFLTFVIPLIWFILSTRAIPFDILGITIYLDNRRLKRAVVWQKCDSMKIDFRWMAPKAYDEMIWMLSRLRVVCCHIKPIYIQYRHKHNGTPLTKCRSRKWNFLYLISCRKNASNCSCEEIPCAKIFLSPFLTRSNMLHILASFFGCQYQFICNFFRVSVVVAARWREWNHKHILMLYSSVLAILAFLMRLFTINLHATVITTQHTLTHDLWSTK